MMLGYTAALAVIAAPVAPAQTSQTAIEAMMRDSVAAWNAGDLDRFVSVYADDAVFVFGPELKRGKAEITAQYAKDFAKGPARGVLSFQPLAWRTLSPVHMLMVARWKLASGAGEQTGLTTVLYERRKAGWRIISDHSS